MKVRVYSVPASILELDWHKPGKLFPDSTEHRGHFISPGRGSWRSGGTEATLGSISPSHCLPLSILSSQQKAGSPAPHSQCQNPHHGTGALALCLLQRYPETLRISLRFTPGAPHIGVSASPFMTPLGGCLHMIRPIHLRNDSIL